MPWLYKPCSKKDARFQARCRVFARAALHGKTFLTEVVRPGMECFPQWCVRGGNGWGPMQMGARPQWCNEAAASKKQGMASQTKGATGRCIWGWVRSPLHCSTKACVYGFSKTHERAHPCQI